MAIANGSQTKGLRNSVGDMTYYQRAGKTISRVKVEKNSSKTEAQQQHRLVMKTTGHLSKRFHEAILHGFPERKKGNSATNVFVQLNTANVTAVKDEATGKYTATVDYPRLACAAGDLFIPDVTATPDAETHSIAFEVTTPMEGGRTYSDDVIFAVIYEKKMEICLLTELGPRSETKTTEMQISSRLDMSALEIYAFAVNRKKRMASPSVYLNSK